MSRERDRGTRFETLVVRYLRSALGDGLIDRSPLRGPGADEGDVTGVYLGGRRVVIECKNERRADLAGWVAEAERERGNADAAYGVVCHKRRGRQDPAEQYVTMTLGTLAAIIAGGPELVGGETDER